MPRFSTNPHAGGVGVSEHISLESDIAEIRAKPNPDRPLVQFRLAAGGRGVTTRVCILPDQYISVETQRGRGITDLHTVDMRFVDPRPLGVRKVPWPLVYTAIGATAITAILVGVEARWPGIVERIGGVLTTLGAGAVTIASYLACYYLSTESLLFLSVHGRARVITISGRLGTIRRAHRCAADLASHINNARRKFDQRRQAYLRDEMREHTRLYEHGLLTEEQYDEAKRRILKAHE